VAGGARVVQGDVRGGEISGAETDAAGAMAMTAGALHTLTYKEPPLSLPVSTQRRRSHSTADSRTEPIAKLSAVPAATTPHPQSVGTFSKWE
jgi:hypothetical protein